MKILHVLPTGMGVVAILLSLTTAWEALSVYEKSKELLGSDYWKQYSDFMKMATELPDATQKMGSFLVDRAKEELSAKEAELQTLLKTFYASEERLLKEFGVEKEESTARRIELAAEQGSLEEKTRLSQAEKENQFRLRNERQAEKDEASKKEADYLSQLNEKEFERLLGRKIGYNAGPPRTWSAGSFPVPRIGRFGYAVLILDPVVTMALAPALFYTAAIGDERYKCWSDATVNCALLNKFQQTGGLAKAEAIYATADKRWQAAEAQLKLQADVLNQCIVRIKAQDDIIRNLAEEYQKKKKALIDNWNAQVSVIKNEQERLKKKIDYYIEHPEEAAGHIQKHHLTKIFFWWLSVAGFCTSLTLTALAYLRLCLLAGIFGPRIISPNL